MNISINKTSFLGKKEVYAGLKLAAEEAQKAEMFRAMSFGPKPINKTTEQKVSDAMSKAYIRLATYDESFYSTIKDLNNKELDALRIVLEMKALQFTNIHPLENFKLAIIRSLRDNKKQVNFSVLNEFFAKIADRVNYKK